MAVDFGKYARATSLDLIAQKTFLEFGKLMNQKKTFTITALKYEDIGIGDVNMHYDCIMVPNMGGYKFPHFRALASNNLVIGLCGIDEVILGQQVYKTKAEWLKNKPVIEKEVPKWERYVDKIRLLHVATNSEKEQMTEYLKIPPEKIHVINYGVDHEIFKPAANKEDERKKVLGKFYIKDNPYFIHIGESNWTRKNVLRMIRAFKEAKETGIKHNLIIVGRTDPLVESAASITGIKVLGFVSAEDLARLLQCADAMILPSLHEGFGFPLVEAMACGVPVITSNVYSPPELVGDAGLLVDPYDVSDIASKIVEMSTNESLRKTLAKRALERSKLYDWSYVAKRLLDLVEKNVRYESDHFNFEESYEISAYRTLTTVCEIKPELRAITIQDLLEFDYSKIISWARKVGLEDPTVRDFLMPFKEWLESHDS